MNALPRYVVREKTDKGPIDTFPMPLKMAEDYAAMRRTQLRRRRLDGLVSVDVVPVELKR